MTAIATEKEQASAVAFYRSYVLIKLVRPSTRDFAVARAWEIGTGDTTAPMRETDVRIENVVLASGRFDIQVTVKALSSATLRTWVTQLARAMNPIAINESYMTDPDGVA